MQMKRFRFVSSTPRGIFQTVEITCLIEDKEGGEKKKRRGKERKGMKYEIDRARL